MPLIKVKICPDCKGTGIKIIRDTVISKVEQRCPTCKGTGNLQEFQK